MVVAERPVSLQALWRFIAMVRDCDWHDQFNCERFGAFKIVEGHGPVTYCGKGLVIALHIVHGSNALCGKRLIVVLYDICGQQLMWLSG